MRHRTKLTLTLAATVTMLAALAGAAVAAGPALAKTYPPPSIHLPCSAAANNGTLEGTVCALPSGMTTPPNAYSATIAVSKAGAAGPTVTFALTAGSLPPGLTMPTQGTSGTVITGNPTQAGTFSFTVKATDGNLTATQAYRITITVQGAPDQLQCNAANGSFLISGVCALPDAVLGQPYQGHLVTSHNAGGTLSIAAGALPPGLSLPATFGSSGAIIGGTATQQGIEPTYSFTVQGTGDQGQPLWQPYQITVDQNLPLTIVLPGQRINPRAGNGRPGLRAELLPQRRGRTLQLGRRLRAASARAGLADLRGADRRQQRAHRNADHGRHLHLHHAAERLRRPAGHPAVQPDHRQVAHPARPGRDR